VSNILTASRSVWSKRHIVHLLLGLILLLGTALRFYDLGAESLWLDEVDIVLESQRMNGLSPLRSPTHLLERLALALGRQDYVLRFPFALIGILSIAAFYRLVRFALGGSEGLIGALLLAISPFHIWYSQEARYYALIVLFTLLAVYFLWLALEENRWWQWSGFVLTSVLGIKNVSAGFFPLASLALFAGLVLLGRTIGKVRQHSRSGLFAPDTLISNPSPKLSRRSRIATLPVGWLSFFASLILIAALIYPQIASSSKQVVVPTVSASETDVAEKLFEPSARYLLVLFNKYGIWGYASWRAQVVSWAAFAAGLAALVYRRRWKVGGLLLMDVVENPEEKVVYFMSLDSVKWRRPVTPGDQIVFELEMLQFRRHVCKMKGTGTVEGNVVAEAELMARIMDR